MDPQVEDSVNQLHKIKDARDAQEKLEKIFDEFHREVEFYRSEDSHLKDYKGLFESLDQEKKAHVEELRNINNDMNTLETNIKQSESEQMRSWENARQLLQKMRSLVEEANKARASLGEELVPEAIIKPEDIELLEQPIPQQIQAPPTLPAWYSLMHRDFQMAGIFDRASIYGQPSSGTGHMGGFNPLRAPAMNISAATTNNAGLSGTERGTGSDVRGSPEVGSSAGFGKQQPPPMKTCNSCQQQIHRNAPICPMCKSKSRSKNPKKPKRKIDEF